MNKAVPICFIALVALAFINFPIFLLVLFLMTIVAGISKANEAIAHKQAAARNDQFLKQKLHAHLDNIKNSDGEPSLPFEQK